MRTYNLPDNLISLGENYFFSADENCYTLYRIIQRKKIDVKTKKELEEMIEDAHIISYYSTLEALLKDCIEKEVRYDVQKGYAKTIEDCIERIHSFHSYLQKATKGY